MTHYCPHEDCDWHDPDEEKSLRQVRAHCSSKPNHDWDAVKETVEAQAESQENTDSGEETPGGETEETGETEAEDPGTPESEDSEDSETPESDTETDDMVDPEEYEAQHSDSDTDEATADGNGDTTTETDSGAFDVLFSVPWWFWFGAFAVGVAYLAFKARDDDTEELPSGDDDTEELPSGDGGGLTDLDLEDAEFHTDE